MQIGIGLVIAIGIIYYIYRVFRKNIANSKKKTRYKREYHPNYGKREEMKVASILSTLPKDEYHVLNDVLLKDDEGWTTQIDHLIASKYGLFIIETKNIKGVISGGENSDHWIQTINGWKYNFHNPVYQNEAHQIGIKKILGEDGNITMIPIVAFSNLSTLLVKAEYSTLINVRDLKDTILKYREEVLTDEKVSRIYRALMNANVTDKIEREKHINKVRQQKDKKAAKIANDTCPRCGGKLVEINGPYGHFWGCSNYPLCKYTYHDDENENVAKGYQQTYKYSYREKHTWTPKNF